MSHSPEPWVEAYSTVFTDTDRSHNRDLMVADCRKGVSASLARENARRIVACVNACRGISTERLEKTGRVHAHDCDHSHPDGECSCQGD